MRERFLVPVTLGLLIIPVGAGCRLYKPKGEHRNPETKVVDAGPSGPDVFDVTREVILERYQFASPVKKSNLVMALTPIVMDGGSKSRKQITVQVRQNYTGAWEPTVRVVKYIEVGDPILGADPEAEDPAGAMPVAANRWKPLQTMPIEEIAIRDAILARLDMPAGGKS